jgi:hypothetical protein
MPSKKKLIFGIIHSPNPDLTYIKNPERKKIMFMPFHLLKTYIRNLLYSLFLFSPSHLQVNIDGNHDPSVHICAWGGEFCQVSIFAKLVCQTVVDQFFLFCQN